MEPPLVAHPSPVLHAAIGSLALGGAERIVLDWAAASSRHLRVRLIVVRQSPTAWIAPPHVDCVFLDTSRAKLDALMEQGRLIASSGHTRILCHLLDAQERSALAAGGARPIPVVHNARAGWIEHASNYSHCAEVIAVSEAAARELQAIGARTTVLRHFPMRPDMHPDARTSWRHRWCIPTDAFCIGMIGGVKPQKAYPRALRILAALRERRDAYLVVIGGPVGRDGLTAWHAVIDQARRLRLEPWVRMPGFIRDAARTLPAFELLLNTSRYEGISIATMEALAAGLPVVAADVGGQAEIVQEGLHLLPFDAPVFDWCETIERARVYRPVRPAWTGFPSTRLWTLHHIDVPHRKGDGVLFVTANLNAGGAQRSLVNLVPTLNAHMRLSIAVCGESSRDDFYRRLQRSNIDVRRTAASRDCFDHAQALLVYIASADIGTVVFWNVDPKVKLLLTKRLRDHPTRLIDVSPGHYAFEEMDAIEDFQRWIAFRSADYYARLDRLVFKYRTPTVVPARTTCIPNGVPLPGDCRQSIDTARRVVVSGRIAPTKFLLEILAAMHIVWREIPDARLHILGDAEERHRAYADRVLEAIGAEVDRRVILHGAAVDAPERLADFEIALVIGRHQGSPNAVLEAMAAGLVVVANDSGGTREIVIDGRTGILLPDREPPTIAQGLLRLMHDRTLASKLARAGRRHVKKRFSMLRMTYAYRRLLAD